MSQKKPLSLEQVREVGQLLKAADRYTLAGEFERALEQVQKALGVDPQNAYALAYEERIANFRKEAEIRNKEDALQSELEAKLRSERDAKKKAEEEAQARLALADKPLEERKAIFQEELSKLWRHGKPSPEQRAQLEKLQRTLSISETEEERLEGHVKLRSYVSAIKEAWEQGRVSPTTTEVLEELRGKFEVSSQEHLGIESQILWQLQGAKNRGVILVVDDDEDYLKVMSDILRSNGYTPIPCISPEDALNALKKTMPDLILLDINFPKPSMSGFLFYEKIREQEALDVVPVIFVSALTEDNIILAGKQLGADDYITKPFSEDTLVASMEGRLRRYQLLKSRRKRTTS